MAAVPTTVTSAPWSWCTNGTAAAGMRLLDLAKHHGFQFQRIAPGPDGPLWGVRETEDWQDTIYLGGFWAPDSYTAVRRRKSLPTRSW